MTDTANCSCCGKSFPIAMLDAKPPSLAGKLTTWPQLFEASDNGENFTVLECKNCYGPAWCEGV